MQVPCISGGSIERARVVAWLMLRRARARHDISVPELAGAIEALLGVLIEEIAGGSHESIDVLAPVERESVH